MLAHIGKPVPNWQKFVIDIHAAIQFSRRLHKITVEDVERMVRAGRYLTRDEMWTYFENRINTNERQFIYSDEEGVIFYIYASNRGFVVATAVEAVPRIQYRSY